MNRFVTALRSALGLILLLTAIPAAAQNRGDIPDVTIRQLNALSQSTIDALNALGPDATIEQIQALLAAPQGGNPGAFAFEGQQVRVTAVVLTDPRLSGLGTWQAALGRPNRIHVWLRDVAAATDGVEGMGIQIVDDTGAALPLRPGDVVEVEGTLTVFRGSSRGAVLQLGPIDNTSITVIDEVDLDDPIMQPVVVTTDDLNTVVGTSGTGDPLVRINWNNWNSLNGQYVRFEGATITNSTEAPTGRPNWAWSSAGTESRVPAADISLRFRNDRSGSYQAPFFVRPANEPFTPPPPGAVVNVQGFVTFNSFVPFDLALPFSAAWVVNPMADEDFELASSPPVIALLPLTGVPTGPFEVEAEIAVAGGATLTSATLNYTSSNGQSGSVAMTVGAGENRFVGTIPAAAATDGAFITFSVTAVDSNGLENSSPTRTTRVLQAGITVIEHIQRTANDGQGPSPFAGITTPMNVEATIQTNPQQSGFIVIQDGIDPWHGVFVQPTEQLTAQATRGQRIRITNALIEESFGLTRLVIQPGGFTLLDQVEPFPYVTGLPTGLFTDPDFAEGYEGMMVRFNDVVVTSENPDAPSNFGEWAFSSDGTTQNQLRADDESPLVPFGSDTFDVGDELEFIQGALTFTFSNFKLWPESPTDWAFTSSTEGGTAGLTTAFTGTFPNPTFGRATVTYTLAQDADVRLEVFDVTGRRVTVLVDGRQAAGAQQVALDTRDLASGVYLVRLATDATVQTTRLVVAR